MRFSKWHALGNTYLVVDEAMEAELARRICDVRYGVGSDGVVEVVATSGATAEIVIWNPDGSVAEFSGNGSRIAAAWLGARAGTAQVTIAVDGRSYPAAIRADGSVAMGVGDVQVRETETITVGGQRIELTPVSVGNPHAVVRLVRSHAGTARRVPPDRVGGLRGRPGVRHPRRTPRLGRPRGGDDLACGAPQARLRFGRADRVGPLQPGWTR